jgi:hypothetical protein
MINTILANNNSLPVLDGPATVLSYSDRYPCTVISLTDKEVIVQEDHSRRIDSNGMSETQNYDYSRNLNGRTFTYRKVKSGRRKGQWREGGLTDGIGIIFGTREKYYNFSF